MLQNFNLKIRDLSTSHTLNWSVRYFGFRFVNRTGIIKPHNQSLFFFRSYSPSSLADSSERFSIPICFDKDHNAPTGKKLLQLQNKLNDSLMGQLPCCPQTSVQLFNCQTLVVQSQQLCVHSVNLSGCRAATPLCTYVAWHLNYPQ